jgi:hypothetical protein
MNKQRQQDETLLLKMKDSATWSEAVQVGRHYLCIGNW